jgi:hypothetical protein
MIHGHERECRVDHRVHDGDVELVDRVDGLPIGRGRPTERVYTELDAGSPDDLHIHDVPEILDIRQDQVLLVGAVCLDGAREWHPLHAGGAAPQQLVGSVLHPFGNLEIGRSAVGRVVLEAAVLRRVVGRRGHDAVSEMGLAAAIVAENGPGNDRRRSEAIVALDDGLHRVGGQYLECRALGRTRHRVGVLTHIDRAVDTLGAAIVADGLGDRRDVSRGERAAERRAPMPAGAEADELARITQVGLPFVVLPLELGQIDQQGLGGRLAGQRRDRGQVLHATRGRGLHYGTGHGLTSQISAAYSAMVRSLENLPEPATFRIALRVHPSGSA